MPKKQETVEARPSHVIAYHALQDAINTVMALSPHDGSDTDGRYAVTVDELQKAFAYFNTYVFIPAQAPIPPTE